MVASSSFTAHPESIRQLGGQFCAASADLAGPAGEFIGSASEADDAFGLLGACDDAMEKYLSMAQSTQSSLDKLIAVLQQGGEILQQQGANDELVDNAVASKAGRLRSPSRTSSASPTSSPRPSWISPRTSPPTSPPTSARTS